jgi:hypothetical protein
VRRGTERALLIASRNQPARFGHTVDRYLRQVLYAHLPVTRRMLDGQTDPRARLDRSTSRGQRRWASRSGVDEQQIVDLLVVYLEVRQKQSRGGAVQLRQDICQRARDDAGALFELAFH